MMQVLSPVSVQLNSNVNFLGDSSKAVGVSLPSPHTQQGVGVEKAVRFCHSELFSGFLLLKTLELVSCPVCVMSLC